MLTPRAATCLGVVEGFLQVRKLRGENVIVWPETRGAAQRLAVWCERTGIPVPRVNGDREFVCSQFHKDTCVSLGFAFVGGKIQTTSGSGTNLPSEITFATGTSNRFPFLALTEATQVRAG